MANKNIKDLPRVNSNLVSDEIHISRSIADRKVTLSDLLLGISDTIGTAQNVGTGVGLYKEKLKGILSFRTLISNHANLTITENGNVVELGFVGVFTPESSTLISPASGAVVLDCDNGNVSVFILELESATAVTDISITNTPTVANYGITIIIKTHAGGVPSITFGDQFVWDGGTIPTINETSKRYIIAANTYDDGVTYDALLAMKTAE